MTRSSGPLLERFVTVVGACTLLATWATAAPAHALAQRVPPAMLSISPEGEGHRLVLTIQASERVEISADRRWLRAELRDERGRRLTCAAPVRPRPGSRPRTLDAGERWSEWFDVREICWGRALDALASARELTFHFDAGRARAAWVARTPAASHRALAPVATAWRPPVAGPPASGRMPSREAGGAVSVRMLPSDALLGARPTFRVSVGSASGAALRAFVRPEAVSFQVLAPSGRSFACAVPPFEGRALPDFFVRLTALRPLVLGLDAQAYCGRFEEPGIYEITPVVTLRERGEAWHLDATTGVFRGPAAPLRVRASTYVEQPAEAR